MKKVYVLENTFVDCDWHYEIDTRYGFFLTRESAEKCIDDEQLMRYGTYTTEGYRVVELTINESEEV